MAVIKASDEQTQKYYDFLEKLRQSGKTNMFGARPFLARKFGLDEEESRKILSAWMGAHKA